MPWLHRELDLTVWMHFYLDFLARTGALENEASFLARLRSKDTFPGLASLNIRPWAPSFPGTELPIAVLPSYVHQRMATQLSRFTIHGRLQPGFDKVIGEEVLVKFPIN